jgi:prepilin-type N-terminal cleavage/methylation domain-containing protein
MKIITSTLPKFYFRKQIVPRSTPSSGRTRAFTLIEMMVVIAIMIIVAGFMAPALTSLSKANGRKAAIANLLGGIEQARAEAIKSGQATYVVFPAFTSGRQSTLDRYNYKAYAIFEEPPPSPSPTPAPQLTAWKSLPTGVALRAAGNSALSNLPAPPVTLPAFAPDTNASPTYYCFKFNSNGEIEAPATNVLLSVFEGFINGTTEVITGAKDANGNPLAAEYIAVFRMTGRAEPTAAPTP